VGSVAIADCQISRVVFSDEIIWAWADQGA
jgi:hypothetical protein